MFRELFVRDFPPFGEVLFKFPAVENKPPELAEVHLFTGVNGTGKTRLLTLLAAMLGHDASLRNRLKGTNSHIQISIPDKTGTHQLPNTWPVRCSFMADSVPCLLRM